MAKNTTPEKVKQLLSSFLVSGNQVPERLSPSKRKVISSTDDSNGQTTVKTSSTGSGILRSYESFQERLDSFSSLTWFGKPAELSPLLCARFGWENVDIDMLKCVGCQATLSGQLPTKTDTDAYKKFKDKLKDNLLKSHDRFCPLAVNPCPESFCIVRCDDPVSLTSGFISRISSLNPMRRHLPSLDFTSIHKYGYDEGQGAAYCTRHLLPDLDVSPEVVTLSVTGWTKSPSSNDVLMCSMCRRLVGLWNFSQEGNGNVGAAHSDEDNEPASDQDESTPKAKRRKMEAKTTFDPLEEHKHWCPWIAPTNPALSSSTGPSVTPSEWEGGGAGEPDLQPACIVALKAIAPGLMDNNTGLAQALRVSPMVEGMRNFRQVIKAWSSPKSSTQVAVTTSS